jgi:hypothetical protein
MPAVAVADGRSPAAAGDPVYAAALIGLSAAAAANVTCDASLARERQAFFALPVHDVVDADADAAEEAYSAAYGTEYAAFLAAVTDADPVYTAALANGLSAAAAANVACGASLAAFLEEEEEDAEEEAYSAEEEAYSAAYRTQHTAFLAAVTVAEEEADLAAHLAAPDEPDGPPDEYYGGHRATRSETVLYADNLAAAARYHRCDSQGNEHNPDQYLDYANDNDVLDYAENFCAAIRWHNRCLHWRRCRRCCLQHRLNTIPEPRRQVRTTSDLFRFIYQARQSVKSLLSERDWFTHVLVFHEYDRESIGERNHWDGLNLAVYQIDRPACANYWGTAPSPRTF